MPRIYTNFNSRPSARGDSFLLSLVRPSSTISIHAPPRGATTSKITSGGADVFQFTPLREGRLLKQVGLEARFLFQFTPLREGRRHSVRRRSKPARFQFTPLREGRLHLHRIILRRSLFQFTPLREGRPIRAILQSQGRTISIHAPPRGATFTEKGVVILMDYFNSRPSARGDISTGLINPLKSLFQFTPLREGRRLRRSQQRLSHLFQFTPLREGRRVRTFVFVAGNISIHAPPRGATHRQSAGNCSKSNFNSRPSARGDTWGAKKYASQDEFQFTPLREGRPEIWRTGKRLQHFNSRPSARGDAMGTTCRS